MALTKARNAKQINGNPLPPLVDFKCLTNKVIYKGAMVVLKDGYAKPGVTGTGLMAVGMATKTVDTTGIASGAYSVPVQPGIARWNNSADADAIAQANVGALAYIVDDQTVALTDGSATRSIAGTIYAVDSSGVYVMQGLVPSVDGTALAAEIALREAIVTNLALTTSAATAGAKTIGIYDVASKITATNVETALAELAADHYTTYIHLAVNVAGECQKLTGAGAVNLTTRTTRVTSSGTLDALTLADSTQTGQRKTIIMAVDGGSARLTAGGSLHLSDSIATITFTNVRDSVELEWSAVDTCWNVVGYTGCTFA